tara:strand:+ start:616 stop:795 length:180 start_codon:yes stop_codon:yes gene_type:complete
MDINKDFSKDMGSFVESMMEANMSKEEIIAVGADSNTKKIFETLVEIEDCKKKISNQKK